MWIQRRFYLLMVNIHGYGVPNRGKSVIITTQIIKCLLEINSSFNYNKITPIKVIGDSKFLWCVVQGKSIMGFVTLINRWMSYNYYSNILATLKNGVIMEYIYNNMPDILILIGVLYIQQSSIYSIKEDIKNKRNIVINGNHNEKVANEVKIMLYYNVIREEDIYIHINDLCLWIIMPQIYGLLIQGIIDQYIYRSNVIPAESFNEPIMESL